MGYAKCVQSLRYFLATAIATLALLSASLPKNASAATAEDLDADSRQALQSLYKAVDYLQKTKGWEIGVSPSVVVVDEGIARNLSSTTLQDDTYAFIFNQQRLMTGISIEGTKIYLIKR
ncbi:MAG TPA: hypothetical protein VIZ86_07485 [Pseudomonas sp.]